MTECSSLLIRSVQFFSNELLSKPHVNLVPARRGRQAFSGILAQLEHVAVSSIYVGTTAFYLQLWHTPFKIYVFLAYITNVYTQTD